jgi:hypothetical protein
VSALRALPRFRLVLALGAILTGAAVATVIVFGGNTGSGVLTNGSPSGDTYSGGIGTAPGQIADFPVTVENTGTVPVTLEAARLVPLPGFRTPRLVHLGVLVEHNELESGDIGWPIPRDNPSTGYLAMRPLRGYVVLPWTERQRRHLGPMPDMVEYGVVGTGAGRYYAAAGLDLTYRVGGRTYTQRLIDGGADCIIPGYPKLPANSPKLKPCFAFYNRAGNAADALAAAHPTG